MAKQKEIEVTITTDGKVHLDMVGYEGKECEGQLDALAKALGTIESSQRKDDFYKEKTVINRRS